MQMMVGVIGLFGDNFEQAPSCMMFDIDDAVNEVYSGQLLDVLDMNCDSCRFQPFHLYEGIAAKPVAISLPQGTTPEGADVARVARYLNRSHHERTTTHRSQSLPNRRKFGTPTRGQ